MRAYEVAEGSQEESETVSHGGTAESCTSYKKSCICAWCVLHIYDTLLYAWHLGDTQQCMRILRVLSVGIGSVQKLTT